MWWAESSSGQPWAARLRVVPAATCTMKILCARTHECPQRALQQMLPLLCPQWWTGMVEPFHVLCLSQESSSTLIYQSNDFSAAMQRMVAEIKSIRNACSSAQKIHKQFVNIMSFYTNSLKCYRIHLIKVWQMCSAPDRINSNSVFLLI